LFTGASATTSSTATTTRAYPNRVVVDVCKADATNALGMAKGFEGGVSGYGEDVSFFNENAVGVSDYGSAGKYK
jgi:hypothetical protein